MRALSSTECKLQYLKQTLTSELEKMSTKDQHPMLTTPSHNTPSTKHTPHTLPSQNVQQTPSKSKEMELKQTNSRDENTEYEKLNKKTSPPAKIGVYDLEKNGKVLTEGRTTHNNETEGDSCTGQDSDAEMEIARAGGDEDNVDDRFSPLAFEKEVSPLVLSPGEIILIRIATHVHHRKEKINIH